MTGRVTFFGTDRAHPTVFGEHQAIQFGDAGAASCNPSLWGCYSETAFNPHERRYALITEWGTSLCAVPQPLSMLRVDVHPMATAAHVPGVKAVLCEDPSGFLYVNATDCLVALVNVNPRNLSEASGNLEIDSNLNAPPFGNHWIPDHGGHPAGDGWPPGWVPREIGVRFPTKEEDDLYERRSFWVRVNADKERPTMEVRVKQRHSIPCISQPMHSIDGNNVLDTLPPRATFRPCEGRPTLAPVEGKVYMHPQFNNMATYISQKDYDEAMRKMRG